MIFWLIQISVFILYFNQFGKIIFLMNKKIRNIKSKFVVSPISELKIKP